MGTYLINSNYTMSYSTSVIINEDSEEYSRYPETNLFDFDPPFQNLVPPVNIFSGDYARFNRYEELRKVESQRPVHIRWASGRTKSLEHPNELPLLPEIDSKDLTFTHHMPECGQLGTTYFFVVEVDSVQWLLKLVSILFSIAPSQCYLTAGDSSLIKLICTMMRVMKCHPY